MTTTSVASAGNGAAHARLPSERVRAADGWIALGYFVVYLAWLFHSLESEADHWITMVALPLGIAWLRSTPRGIGAALASVGLGRGAGRGMAIAITAGGAISVWQAFFGGRADAIQELVRSGQALWMFPLVFVLMLATAAFTEELLFRGFLQTRLERLLRSRWIAVLVMAPLFGVYHLPYAYLNPRWPSHGDWGEAWVAALGNGMPGGLLLGALYVVSRGNLLACVVLHALINAAPAMTMIRFSGG
jgi:membrane protease YdiL (CAAX protease family)